MAEDPTDLVSRIRSKYLEPKAPKREGRLRRLVRSPLSKLTDSTGDFSSWYKKLVAGAAITAILGASGVAWLGWDFLTKRQGFPIRHVLYHTQENVYMAGGEEKQNAKSADRESVSAVIKGGEVTRLGDILGTFTREISDEVVHFQVKDPNNNRIAYANEKREPVQGGLRIRGFFDFREQYAEIIGQPGKYITYSFFPERGIRNIQLNVLVDEQGNRHVINELVVYRSIPLGWMFGERFKDQTELNAFADTPKNKPLLEQLLKTIDAYDTIKPEPGTRKIREKMIEEMLSLLRSADRVPVYVSHEDGVIDWLPQESTTYLFANPSRGKRIKAAVRDNGTTAVQQPSPVYPSHEYLSRMHPLAIQNPNGDIVRIRIENSWDLWPGNYWGLNRFRLGKHPNTMKPFEHYNNGAYTIHDDHGVIAQVVFRDLLWSYGEDVVYLYFLDKNGDGKIDREKELIGQVLYRISQDEITDLEPVIGRGMEKKDVTQRYVYTFMAGHDGERRHEEFYLCNAIESFITNELNRGFGQHSVLGYVNNQRSNILFLENRSMANLGRALSPESSLVAKYDIVALLRAAGRTYIERYVQEEGKASAQP